MTQSLTTTPDRPQAEPLSPIPAHQLWPLLTSSQRQIMLRVVVMICRELLPPTTVSMIEEADCDHR